jgi:hypothetical protein
MGLGLLRNIKEPVMLLQVVLVLTMVAGMAVGRAMEDVVVGIILISEVDVERSIRIIITMMKNIKDSIRFWYFSK